jgi:hypothetical protein
VKSFLGLSPIRDLEQALGQYGVYRALLEVLEPGREIYLAVPSGAYHSVFQRRAVQLIVNRFQTKILVVRVDTEEIEQWIS